MSNYVARVRDMCREASTAGQDRAKQLARAGIPVCFYLFYKPATAKEDGKLQLVLDDEPSPAGYELATGEGLRGNIPYDCFTDWIHARSTRLPILSWES